MKHVLLITVLGTAPGSAPAADADVLATFDNGLEGWGTADILGITTHVATGGNPGGYFQHDNSELQFSILIAPEAYLGDLSGYIGGAFPFDGILLGDGGEFFNGPAGIPGGVFLDYGTIQIAGPAGTAQVDLLPGGTTPSLDGWQTYSIALTGAAWGLSDASFAAIMTDVTSLTINIEGLWGPEVNGVDNIALRGATLVPLPGGLALFALSLLGLGAVRRSEPLSHPLTVDRR